MATPIAHPWQSPTDFEASLRELAVLIDRYAIDKFRPDTDNPLEIIRFRQLVHEGWKKAQDRVAALIRTLTDELQSLKRTIKNANHRRDRNRARELAEVVKILETRRNQVQHAANAIVWTIIGNRHHIARRFALHHNSVNFSQVNLFDALTAADEINRDPNKFAAVCDLTSFMHVGDLLVVDPGNAVQPFTIIELKSGPVNERCRAVLDQFYETGCGTNLSYGLQSLSDDEVEQVQRMARQDERGALTVEILNNERGTDITTGKPLVIHPQEFAIESFIPEVIRMTERLKSGKSWALETVRDCLHLGLYSDLRLARGAFVAWMKGLEVDGLTIDYKSVFSVMLARPTLTLELPHDVKVKLFTGEWRLMMCLDVITWLRGINVVYPGGAELESKRVSARLRSSGADDLFLYKGQAVRLNFPTGQIHLADGALSKIFFDFYDPVDAMRPYFATQAGAA